MMGIYILLKSDETIKNSNNKNNEIENFIIEMRMPCAINIILKIILFF